MEKRNSGHQPDKFYLFFRILNVIRKIFGSQMFSRRVHISLSHFAHFNNRGLRFNQRLNFKHISNMLLNILFFHEVGYPSSLQKPTHPPQTRGTIVIKNDNSIGTDSSRCCIRPQYSLNFCAKLRRLQIGFPK